MAIERGLVTRNPAHELSKVKKVQDAGSASSQGCGDLVEFGAYSGCRIGQAINVIWDDVDFGPGPDLDPDQEKGRIWIGPHKHDNTRCYVPMLPAMRDLLTRIKANPRWFRAQHRQDAGCILSVATCERALTKACAKANATRITHHGLRHLFITKCIESGIDIPTIARWVGHKDGGALLMRVYGHLRDEHSQAMAAKVTF